LPDGVLFNTLRHFENMEDRYEIRGKIGQGGLGAVYRGYDTRMKREVAIKRISTSGGEGDIEEESTRQLIKEAGALASLQHPHIVTVYDVGSDEDGPYVVMELISGKTLDELIEHAPLTWTDFRELALQTQEALIAAQELDMIHSDLKPSNLMLTWLPSGKFQVKIVDFGLATLAQSQSKEDLEAMDAVFGSIFFMAPEQFERVPLDARSDLYSMGCVYYQALTGAYPFNGATGNEVMASHLHHQVTPIQELRSDIPMWACDWIMWQINRNPQDRPESARDSLSVFLQNDKNPNPTMSLGSAQSNAAKRPRLIIPGSEPGPVAQATPTQSMIPTAVPVPAAVPTTASPTQAIAPAPVLVRASAKPKPPTESTPVPVATPAANPPDTVDMSEATKSKSAPQPLTPPQGSKPSVHTSTQAIPEAAPAVTQTIAPAQPVPTRSPAAQAGPPVKRKLSNAAKSTIAAIMGIVVVLMVWYLLDRSGKNRETQLYNEMITQAAKGDATEVPVNSIKLKILLDSAANTGLNEQRQTIYKALLLAKPTDGTDVDARIVEFATRTEMLPDVREVLIRDVLRMRKNAAVVPALMAYARSTQDPRAAVSAIEAVRFMAGEEQFDEFLGVLQSTSNDQIRNAVEDTLAQVIKKSTSRDSLATRLAAAYASSLNENVRHSLLRLLGRCGGEKALDTVKAALAGEDTALQYAAINALGAWGDDTGLPILTEFLATTKSEGHRSKAFDAALKFVSDPSRKHTSETDKVHWTLLKQHARTRGEQEKVIQGLFNLDDDWALELLKEYTKSEDEGIVDYAEKAIRAVEERKRLNRDK
jgi:serine/threonine protein kinase